SPALPVELTALGRDLSRRQELKAARRGRLKYQHCCATWCCVLACVIWFLSSVRWSLGTRVRALVRARSPLRVWPAAYALTARHSYPLAVFGLASVSSSQVLAAPA